MRLMGLGLLTLHARLLPPPPPLLLLLLRLLHMLAIAPHTLLMQLLIMR